MHVFEVSGDTVVWRGDGETLLVQAWGSDSVRVRARLMGDVLDTDYALQRPEPADAAVDVDGESVASNRARSTLEPLARENLHHRQRFGYRTTRDTANDGISTYADIRPQGECVDHD